MNIDLYFALIKKPKISSGKARPPVGRVTLNKTLSHEKINGFEMHVLKKPYKNSKCLCLEIIFLDTKKQF